MLSLFGASRRAESGLPVPNTARATERPALPPGSGQQEDPHAPGVVGDGGVHEAHLQRGILSHQVIDVLVLGRVEGRRGGRVLPGLPPVQADLDGPRPQRSRRWGPHACEDELGVEPDTAVRDVRAREHGRGLRLTGLLASDDVVPPHVEGALHRCSVRPALLERQLAGDGRAAPGVEPQRFLLLRPG